MKNLLPILKIGQRNEIRDGVVLEAHSSCKKNCNSKSCHNFYKQLESKTDGFYTCPKGLTAYVSRANGLLVIYTSMRVKGHYNKKATKDMSKSSSSNESFAPAIGEDLFLRLKSCDFTIADQETIIERAKGIHSELFHDIRKICAHIKNKSEDIIAFEDNTREIAENCDTFEVLQRVKNIEALASVATSRFDVYDISMNPEIMCLGQKRNRTVYKKFHKARYMLTNYLEKNVTITMSGQSVFSHPIYQTFDVLPFILLENAIKYAPENSDVTVCFREEYNNLYVTIVSEGPTCTEEELPYLLAKGFRGANAKLTKVPGNGLGLSLAKEICDAHNIIMRINSNFNHTINGIPYGDFEVNLTFFSL